MSGKRAFLDVLKQEGVEIMFGNPGTTELPLMDAFATENELRYLLGLQEAAVMAMAGVSTDSRKIVRLDLNVNGFRDWTADAIKAGAATKRSLGSLSALAVDVAYSGTELSLDGLWNIDVVVQESTSSVTVPLRFRTMLPSEQISISVVPGQPTLSTVTLADGGSMQGYVDPGSAGPNAVHFTFFQASGNEQPIKSAEASSISPQGASAPIKLIRFDPGHFVSNQTLESGRWTFRINATLADGTVSSAYFNWES
jgi:hypothetical protein